MNTNVVFQLPLRVLSRGCIAALDQGLLEGAQPWALQATRDYMQGTPRVAGLHATAFLATYMHCISATTRTMAVLAHDNGARSCLSLPPMCPVTAATPTNRAPT